MNLTKMIMVFLVIVVGALITTAVDSALGLNQVFVDLGSAKAIIHKTVYMLQGGAIVAVVLWKKT